MTGHTETPDSSALSNASDASDASEVSDISDTPQSSGIAVAVAELVRGYRPADPVEAGDLARVRVLVAGTTDPWSRSSPLHLTASAVVVHPPTARVLLRWHRRQQTWLQVGGHADPGERYPLAIALREGEEETGLTDLAPWPDARLAHVVVVPVTASADEPAHEHADLRFVLATNEPGAARPERPDAPLRWVTVAEGMELATNPNVRETLSRVGRMLGV